jgi:short-subunit dehydrogenase
LLCGHVHRWYLARATIGAVHIGPGTRAFVTGASRGIGRALAEALAARGAMVGLAARSTDELEALAEALPGAHHVLACDVTVRASVQDAVERLVAAAGGLDLVVANAGIAHYAPVAAQDVARIEEMTQVNWLGTVHTVTAALPHLLRAEAGHVVVMSSATALRAFPGAAGYSATKAAQLAFAEALRHELAATRVSVTTVHPAEIATSLHDHERGALPPWHRGDDAARPAEALALRVIAAVERDRRALHHPPVVRAMGVLNGVAPGLLDGVLRRLRGAAAAPRPARPERRTAARRRR